MGACNSNGNLSPEAKARLEEELARTKKLDKSISNDFNKGAGTIKLLLLGAGESGKSTLFKQMHNIYGKGFSEDERKGFIPTVYSNVTSAMQTLCAHVHFFGQVLPENEAIYQAMLTVPKDQAVDEQVGNMIQQLWDDPAIKLTFDNRAKFQLTDSAAYFFDKVHEIAQRNYVPNQQDVLRARVRTTGIVESTHIIEKNEFRLFDVGGQRNERKKWIHCFDNVQAVLFVAALSEYDQVTYEDGKTNRLIESLTLFGEISNLPWFRKSAIFLFLNKRDLFNDKVVRARVPLSSFFPTFPGPDYDAAVAQEWILAQFLAQCKDKNKTIYPHITCATDTDNVRRVLNGITDMFNRGAMHDAGLGMS